MSDQQPPADGQINGSVGGPPVSVQPEPVVAPPAAAAPLKRQRRPSVRLGDIGDQHTYDNNRRTTKQQQQQQHQWKFPAKDSKSSKTRPLVNLSGAISGEFQDAGGEDKDGRGENHHNLNNCSNGGNGGNGNGVIGSWKARDLAKSKRGFSGAKRVRSNWGSKMEEGDEKFDDGDDFEQDDDDQSLNFSMDNERDLNYVGGDDRGKEARVRVSDGVELDGPSDTDERNWNNNQIERNGVRVWLNQLGLGRYAPVFEVHEVDDEVLPLLTLEDLKDMGINAVGSRRKMFCSIQKLGKGFS